MIEKTNKTPVTNETFYFNELRLELWKKAIGNSSIDKGNHYYVRIKKDIFKQTDFQISRDTIRNFFEGRNSPQPKPLDIYSTYVLGRDSSSPATFKDFQNSINSRLTVHNLKKAFKERRKGIIFTGGGILLSILLVSIVLIRKKTINSNETFTLRSTQQIEISPRAGDLKNMLPTKELIKSLYFDFRFSENEYVEEIEAQRMLQWLGITELEYYAGGAEPFYSGNLSSGCMVTIWVGTYGKRDVYGLRCNCNKTSFYSFKPYYLEIPKIKPVKSKQPQYKPGLLTKQIYSN